MFFECENTQHLWQQLKSFFENKINLPDLDLQSAIVGFLDTANAHNVLINNILLTFKMTLYKFRDKRNITFSKIINNLKSREKIEKQIAHGNSKLLFHERKWNIIIDILHGYP